MVRLYDSVLHRIHLACRTLAMGNRRSAGAFLDRASTLLVELERHLDHEAEPELAADLAGLYDACRHALREGLTEDDPERLLEAADGLQPLRDLWSCGRSRAGVS